MEADAGSQGESKSLCGPVFGEVLSKEETVNEYTELKKPSHRAQTSYPNLVEKDAEDVMKKLREDGATGPDSLPARILKQCATELAWPVLLLFLCILQSGVWPELWLQHWVVPLHKKKSVFQPGK